MWEDLLIDEAKRRREIFENLDEYFKNMSPDIGGQLEIDLYEGESLELFFNYIDERLKSSLDPTIEFMKEYKMKFLNTLKLIKENYKRLNKQFT